MIGRLSARPPLFALVLGGGAARGAAHIGVLRALSEEGLFPDLVVGVSGFTVRPPEARKKPRVSSFLDANFDQILELKVEADDGRPPAARGRAQPVR